MRGVLGVPDGDLLEIFDAPKIAVLAHRAQVEAGDAERPRANFGIPTVEAAEVEVGRAVGQTPRLDGIQIVDQEQEHVAVRGVERRGFLGDVDVRVVDPARPVERAGHLPAGVAGAVACDAAHRLHQLVVKNAAVVRSGDGAQLLPAVFGLKSLHLLGAVRHQPVLQVDASERGGKLAQVSRRRTHQARELAERPVRRRHRGVRAGQHQGEPRRVVALRLDADGGALHRAGAAPLGTALHRGVEVGQRQVALVVRAGEPLRGHAVHVLASGEVDLVATALWHGRFGG